MTNSWNIMRLSLCYYCYYCCCICCDF